MLAVDVDEKANIFPIRTYANTVDKMKIKCRFWFITHFHAAFFYRSFDLGVSIYLSDNNKFSLIDFYREWQPNSKQPFGCMKKKNVKKRQMKLLSRTYTQQTLFDILVT